MSAESVRVARRPGAMVTLLASASLAWGCGSAGDPGPEGVPGLNGTTVGTNAGAGDGGGALDAAADATSGGNNGGTQGTPLLDAAMESGADASGDATTTEGGGDGSLDASGDGSAGADSDGDGIDDATETDDGDPFTDPAVFNGVRVATRGQSDNDITCAMIDSLEGVRDALGGSPDQELDQYAGWDFDDTDDDRTDPGYGFMPPWTDSDDAWQIDAVGYVNLAEGYHCFEVAGETDESCASLFLEATDAASFAGWDSLDGSVAATATHGSGTACQQLPAGVYPIRWHYEMDNGRSAQSFHLNYCHDPDADCTPSEALPARMLRVEP